MSSEDLEKIIVEPQCPNYGCPIEDVVKFYDDNGATHRKFCDVAYVQHDNLINTYIHS